MGLLARCLQIAAEETADVREKVGKEFYQFTRTGVIPSEWADSPAFAEK